MQTKNLAEKIMTIPEDYDLVSETTETRNKKTVTIDRYQKDGKYILNGARIVEVIEGDLLVSFKNYSEVPAGDLLPNAQAEAVAEDVFEKTNPDYAKGLSFIRIEQQQRSFIDEDGKEQIIPVQWIKFGHRNGSYNWVTLGGNGAVVEMEIDSRWDYFHGRRKTEMWDNDDWVLAREGKGPQLPSPQALA